MTETAAMMGLSSLKELPIPQKYDITNPNGGKIGEIREEPGFFGGDSKYAIHNEYGGKVGELRPRGQQRDSVTVMAQDNPELVLILGRIALAIAAVVGVVMAVVWAVRLVVELFGMAFRFLGRVFLFLVDLVASVAWFLVSSLYKGIDVVVPGEPVPLVCGSIIGLICSLAFHKRPTTLWMGVLSGIFGVLNTWLLPAEVGAIVWIVAGIVAIGIAVKWIADDAHTDDASADRPSYGNLSK